MAFIMQVTVQCVICCVFETLVKIRVRVIAVCAVSNNHVNCIVRFVSAVLFGKSVNFKFVGKL